MKRKLSLLIFFLSVTCSYAQITFQKTFGKLGGCGLSVKQTSDGGYIIGGWIEAGIAAWHDACLIKTDRYGDTLWIRKFGSGNVEIAYSVEQTFDGGYILAGETNGFGVGTNDAYLVKTDSNGNMLWSKTYGNQYNDYAYSVLQTNDNGYILAGYNRTTFSNDFQVYVIKTDSTGDTLWTRNYGDGTPYPEYGYSIKRTSDGGYLLAGTCPDTVTSTLNIYLIKLDNNGNVLWSKSYGGDSNEYSYYAEQTNDGGYVIAGLTHSFGVGRKGYVIKTDINGDTLWSKIYYGVNDSLGDNAITFIAIRQTTDGGYIISGYNHTSSSYRDAILIKTDANGNIEWAKSFGGSDYDEGEFAEQTDDGFIFVGCQGSFGTSGLYLIKLDDSGNSGCNEIATLTASSPVQTQVLNYITSGFPTNTIVTTPPTVVNNGDTVVTHCAFIGIEETAHKDNIISLYPNPASDEFRISLSGDFKFQISEIEIYDLLGNKIYTRPYIASIKVSGWSNGMYFVHVKSNDSIKTLKLLVQH